MCEGKAESRLKAPLGKTRAWGLGSKALTTPNTWWHATKCFPQTTGGMPPSVSPKQLVACHQVPHPNDWWRIVRGVCV